MVYPTKNKDLRTMFIGGILIVLVSGGFFFQRWYSRPNPSNPENESGAFSQKENTLPIITAEAVRQKIANGEGIHLLDLRDSESFKVEHIPHSLSISPSTLASFLPDPDWLTVIISSARDTQMLEIIKNSLRQKSFKAYVLEGGFEEWKRKGNQVISFGDPSSFLDRSKIILISPEEALALLKDDTQKIFLLDVQSEQNYQKRHIKSAKNIPLDQLEKRSTEIPSSTLIIVYGESEMTSFQAGVRLFDLNIATAQTLSGDHHLETGSLFLFQP